MNKLKKRIIALAISSVFGVSAFAAEIPCNIEYDYLNNKLAISGEGCKDGDFITVQILKKDKEFESFESADLLYGNQATVGNGTYSFNVGYNTESGMYNARIVSAISDKTTDFKIVISTRADLETIYATLNSAVEVNDSAAFNTAVNENLVFLAANPVQTVGIKGDEYFKYVKANRLNVDDVSDNTKVFNTFLLMESLNEGATENIDSKIGKISIDSEEIKSDYKKTAAEQSIQKYFTAKLSKRQLSTIEGFSKCFKEALILTVARYGSGFGELKTMVEKYKDSVGINEVSSNTNVYKDLIGREYADGKAFCDAYLNAVKDNDTNSSNNGGTSSRATGGILKGTVTTPIDTNTTPERVEIPFEDIEGVDWASEAILALSDKNIINGKEPKKFKPNDNITREEFAKIIVGALGYSPESYTENVFADVNDSDWFCGWVNTAHEKGILKGIGNGMFGSGENISRQDMCVMIANALKIKGTNLTAQDIPFDDWNSIDDYAKPSVGILFGLKVINGVGENRFEPLENATRAQAAKMIYAVLDMLL